MAERFDAVVIGGGPGGATAALLLAQAGWSVALVERKAFPRRKVCGEYLSATNWPLLERLGVAGEFRTRAGPPIRRVGLFAGEDVLSAPLSSEAGASGRALGREQLDSLLVRHAGRAGAAVIQPATVKQIRCEGKDYRCEVEGGLVCRSRVVVAAHGHWEPGPLPTQPSPTPLRPDDLLAFKAHFTETNLPPSLMPLLAFPGGYGGMVHTDAGRVTLSCCIRRDRLSMLRMSGDGAGDAVLDHIREYCRGVRESLAGVRRQGNWLAAGPLRPGIRVRPNGGLFTVGNTAGEAHPVIAEGISMAMQSSWLLTKRLIAVGRNHVDWNEVSVDYVRAWRRAFTLRLRMAAVIAHWAMRPAALVATLPIVEMFPMILGLGARLSGKASHVLR